MKNKTTLKNIFSIVILILCSITTSFAEITLGQIANAEPGSCNGSIEITAEGSAGPFTLELIGPKYSLASNINGTHTFTYLCPGPYTITVSSEYGCDSEFTIFVDGELTFRYPVEITPPTACTSSDGQINFPGFSFDRPTPYGGTPPYTWTWSTGLSGIGEFGISDLSAGDYGLTITDAYGFTFEQTFDLNAPESFDMTETIMSTTGNNCDGSIDITTDAQYPPFLITLVGNGTNIAIESNATTQLFSGLCEGDYTLTIIDANDCQDVLDFTIESCSEIIIGEPTLTNSNCEYAIGQIDFGIQQPEGGTEPYQYLWSNGSTSLSMNELLSGTYTLTITDVSGCTLEKSYTLADGNNPPWDYFLLTVTEVVDDESGSCSGSVTVHLEYGGPVVNCSVYTYLIGNGVTISHFTELEGQETSLDEYYTFENLCGGDYSIVSGYRCNQSECENITDVEVLSCLGLTMSGPPQVIKPSTCNSLDGSINFPIQPNPVGGLAPYSWLWSTGSSEAFLEGLEPGIYSVTVLDGAGCMLEQSFDLTLPSDASAVSFGEIVHSTSGCIGSIEVIGLGGTDLHLTADNGTNTEVTMTGDSYVFNNLCPGDYTVLITDNNGCTSTLLVTLVACANIVIPEPFYITNPSSCETSDGKIYFKFGPSGGTPPYSGVLTDEDGNVYPGLDNLPEGTFTYTVRDKQGCIATETYVLASNATPYIIESAVKDECENLFNGAITLFVQTNQGGTSYDFDWSNGVSQTDDEFGGIGYINGLETGNYALTVTDNNTGCTLEAEFFVDELFPIGIFEAEVLNIVDFCPGGSGSLDVKVNGGNPPYLIRAFGFTANKVIYVGAPGTYTIDDLPGGNYTVSVEDECDRVITKLDNEITEYPPMDIRLVEIVGHCEGDRIIQAVAEGDGVPQVYEWSTDEIENQNYIVGLTIGTYAVTVTDSYGCIESTEITLGELTIDVDVNTAPGLCIYLHPGGSTVIGMATVNVNLDGVPIPNIGFRYSVTYIDPLWGETEIAEGETSSGVFTFEASDYEYTITVIDDCVEHTEILNLEPEAEFIDFILDDPSSFGDWNCEETINGCNGHDEITFFIGMATPEYPALVPQNGGFSDWLVVDTDNCSYKLLCLDGSEMESYTHPETFEVTQLSGNGTTSDPEFYGFYNPENDNLTCFERLYCEFNIDISDPFYGYPIKGNKRVLKSQVDVSDDDSQASVTKVAGTKTDDDAGNGCLEGMTLVTATCGGETVYNQCIPGCLGDESFVGDESTCFVQMQCDGADVGEPFFLGTICHAWDVAGQAYKPVEVCDFTGSPEIIGDVEGGQLVSFENIINDPLKEFCCDILGTLEIPCGAFAPSDTAVNRTIKEQKEIAFAEPFTLNVYPNPFTQELNIEIKSSINTQVTARIIDIMGKELSSEKIDIKKGETAIDLRSSYLNLQPGIYFLLIEDENQNRKNKRIIKM